MSCLVYLPYGQFLDACYEAALRGDGRELKYLLTKAAATWAFRRHAKTRRPTVPSPVQLPSFKTSNLPENPTLCVVTPAYIRNERDFSLLMRMLNSLEAQSERADHIIVVDDGSPHRYALDTERFRHIRLEQNGGPAGARNVGKAEAARLGADLIAFIDTDCIASRNWIEEIRSHFRHDTQASVLSGRTLSYNDGWLGEYHDLDGTLNGRRFRESDFLLYGTTANLAITAEVGGANDFCEQYPDAAAEDIDFCFRAISNGFGIRHAEGMVVHHDYGYNGSVIGNIRRFLRQFQRYGKGERVLLLQIPDYYTYHAESISIANKSLGA